MSEGPTRETAPDPRRRRRIEDLHPRFAGYDIPNPEASRSSPVYRYGVGLEMDCPAHGDHRVTLLFSNPCDGEQKRPGSARYYYRIGNGLDTISLVRADRNYDWITTDCWVGYIASGYVVDGFRFG